MASLITLKPALRTARNEHETVSVVKSNDLLLFLGGVKMAAWRGGLLRHGETRGDSRLPATKRGNV